MASSWEDAPSTTEWEDAPKQHKPTMLQQGAGVAQGIADFAGALPGVVGGTVLGVGDVLFNNEDPRIALEGVGGATKELNLGNLVPSAETYRNTEGFKYSPGTVAAEAIGKSLEGYGKLAGWAAALAGHTDPAKLDAATQLSLMAGLFALRGRAPKPGTPEFYQAISKELPPAQATRASKAARDTYGWEDAPTKVDTTKYNQMDLPMQEPSAIPRGTRSPYNLPPEEVARLNKELNPDAEARVPGQRQGELFTEERPYDPNELVQGTVPRVLDEGPSVRTKDVAQRELDLERQPIEVGFEQNKQEHPYEMTKNGPEPPIPFDNLLTDGGAAGAALEAQRQARTAEAPIPYEKSPPAPDRSPTQVDPNVVGKRADAYYKAAEDALKNGDKATWEKYIKRGDELYQQEQALRAEQKSRPRKEEPQQKTVSQTFWAGPKNQRGMVHPDLLGGKVAEHIRNSGAWETLKKFVGTFSKGALESAVKEITSDKSRETLVWMRPAEFLRLASTRDRSYLDSVSLAKRRGIEAGLKTKDGISAIPHLSIEDSGKVIAHEGRHRMDVFNRNGLDLVPVRLRAVGFRWNERPVGERPKDLTAQHDATNPEYSTIMPALIADQIKQKNILDKHTPGYKQRGAVIIEPLRKQVAKDGVVRTFQDMKKLWLYDKRPFQEMLKEEGISKETLTDLAGKDQALGTRLDKLLQRGLSNVLIDRTMAILSQSKGQIGKIIKNVVDQQTAINQSGKVRAEENIKKAITPWKALRRSNMGDVRSLLDVWTDSIGKDKLTPASFKNTKQWETFKAITDVFTDGLKRVNEARAKAGMKAIDFVENYFPAIREGDYWVHVVDGKGVLVDSYAFKTLAEANKEYALLKESTGNLAEVKPPKLKEPGPYDLSTFSAFEETLASMKKDDPVKDAIRHRYAELSGKRGLGKTGIMKKDIGGALGFEKGELGVKNAEHVIESYIKRQEAYISNLEKGQLQKEVKGSGILENVPLAKGYINAYLEKSRGAELDTLPMIKHLTEAISTGAFGQGRQAGRNFVHNVSAIASLFWLATPKFILLQTVQHLNAMPKALELYNLGDKVSNPIKAWYDGWAESLAPDAISKEGRAWAKKQGALESTIVSLLEMKLHDIKGEKWKAVGEAIRYGMGKEEQVVVRTPVFHMFEKMLREEVPNKLERFEMATNLMDYYMVHYDRESAPLVYDKLGSVAGEAARPLKQYSHNNWGQFFEYAQAVKDKGQLAPLGTYLGVQALVAGMKGVILVAEAAAIITLSNTIFGTDIPTPEELMHGASNWAANKFGDTKEKAGKIMDVADTLIYGGFSTVLGADLSGSLAAPSMPQMFSFPPVSFVANAVPGVFNYLMSVIAGTERDEVTMKAMLSVAPSAMRGWIEALYSEEGGLIPNPNDKMRGNFPVPSDPIDYFKRFGLSLKSIDEAKINSMVRTAKQLGAGDAERRLNALDAIVDRVSNSQPIDNDLIERYITQGGDPARLADNIKQNLIGRELDYSDRSLRGRASPGKARKLDRMKNLLDEKMRKDLKIESESPQSKGPVPTPSDLKQSDANRLKNNIRELRIELTRRDLNEKQKDILREEKATLEAQLSKENKSKASKIGLFSGKANVLDRKYMDSDVTMLERVKGNNKRHTDLMKNMLVSEAQRAYPGDIKKQSDWMREKIEMDNAYTKKDLEEFKAILRDNKNIKRMM